MKTHNEKPISMVPAQLTKKPSKLHATATRTLRFLVLVVSISCSLLVLVDIVGNNWELNDFTGNAKHFLTPLLTTFSIDELVQTYAFPTDSSPWSASNGGRFMINSALNQVHDLGGDYYHLTLGSHTIDTPENNICGQLVDAYPLVNTSKSVVRLGSVQDQVTYIRGTTLTHVFGDSLGTELGHFGDNASKLESLGYVAGRVGLDMRLTTAIPVSTQGKTVTLNVTMYRFFSKSFCSGCAPNTELGMDTCTIVYSTDESTNVLHVHSSGAIYGESHVLGIILLRRWGPVLSLWLRGLCILAVLAAFAASQKTVQWTDTMTFTSSWVKRMVHKFSPPQYRHVNNAFHLLYFCFNSDFTVLMLSVSVMFDEDIAMVYGRVLSRWSKPASFQLWTQLRLYALDFRWMWFNLAILKLLKLACNLVNTARFNGHNVVMGWLNFRSITWVYLTVFVLFERIDYTEYGNSIRVDVTPLEDDLDAIFVEFEHSWYIRGLPSLAMLMLGNLLLVLCVDHVVNRHWWVLVAKTSLGRQHMYNSSSIITDSGLHVSGEGGGVAATITIKARTMSTMRWYFTSHLLCFGLAEEPTALRKTSTTNGAKTPISIHVASEAKLDKVTPSSATTFDAMGDVHFLVQDQEGHVHLIDADKREVQALGVEVKILRDSQFTLG
ncbi:hypothetical protein H257_09512 [Aphanomyces astaci]|uniref:Uncharacterized protein n=2 Tax=Aphanomyces astaci TaxID=112090 RepID=W4G9Y3_APHAT|nr:hypothetical protein H257_09512 [Aphanomyces astaci]ETV76502.1 hypothetical protein H257_09512 [Aphanomyces astaci]RQM19074.1 hypothetical protein B5M09_007505 [Aphanomyces astaci]|eukprot:XP_009834047.1 hypothetical protein H257_09512 [Aphanomyces astaci]